MPAAPSIVGSVGQGIIGTGTAHLGLLQQNKANTAYNTAASMRNPSTESQSMLASQTGSAPGQYSAYAQYNPLYAGIDSAVSRQQFGDSAAMYGQYNPYIDSLNNASNSSYRASTINDASQYAPQIAQQYRDLNPELYSSLNNLSSPSPYESAYGSAALAGSASSSALSSTLGQQAQEQLALGRSLSPAEQRDAQQAARSAGAARGLYDSNQTIGAEILNNYLLGNQRLQERQTFAQNVLGQNTGLLQNAASMQQQRDAASTSAWQQSAYDPYAGILSQQSPNQLSSYGIANLNAQTNAYNQQATRSQFDPYNAYAADIYGQQWQAEMARAGMYSGTSQTAFQQAPQIMAKGFSDLMP